MLVYTQQITPRFQYICETLLLKHLPQLRITDSAEDFHSYEQAKICYAHKKFTDNELHIQPWGLLEQRGISKQNINCFLWNDLKVFFKTNGDIPFDIFSAAFYLISRYEEYLPHRKDSYGRYDHAQSLAYKEGFLDLPLVDLWVEELIHSLKRQFPSLQTSVRTFEFTPTYDIDIAFAYKGRGVLQTVGSLSKSFVKGDLQKIKEITNVVFRKQADPFDVFDWLEGLNGRYNLKPVYFFLLARYRSKYDKNVTPRSKLLQQLINRLSKKYKVGIHPSWASYSDERLLLKEKKILQHLIQEEVSVSRQHYIQFALPQTYRELIALGITHDYSMGYGSINGFRASYASSFYWYDLSKEEKTTLTLHPFCYMDANSFFEQKIDVNEAADELRHYLSIVKQVNGELITIFHNHFLTEEKQWKPWRDMYDEFLERNFKLNG